MKAIKVRENIKARDKSTARVVEYQFPLWIRESAPGFVHFAEHYYKWMEQEGNLYNQIYSLPEYLDIDETTDDFLKFFTMEVMPTIPDAIISSKRLLMKHIKDLYLAKGTEKSVRFLFKLLFNEDIAIEYPNEVILRCSDGEWVKTTFIKTYSSTSIDIIGRKIFGKESGAVAIADKVTVSVIDGNYIDIIELSNISGVFLADEMIETRDNLTYYTAILSGQIRSVTIKNKGSGYLVGEILTPPPSVKTGSAIVTLVDEDGGLVLVDIIEPGFGYNVSAIANNVSSKGANIVYNVGAAFYDKGSYVSERGKLSSICVLQDSYKYQDFSYVVKSTKTLDQYRDILYSTVHPAGLLMIAEVLITGELIGPINNNLNQSLEMTFLFNLEFPSTPLGPTLLPYTLTIT